MASPIIQAIKQICEEKGLSQESVLATVEVALAAAYRKDFGTRTQNIKVEFDPETGSMRIFDIKTVVRDFTEEELEAQKEAAKELPSSQVSAQVSAVEIPEGAVPEEERFNPKTMMMISEAQTIKSDCEVGEELRIELEIPSAFGRMAAQTAKQVMTQKLREAERQTIFEEWSDKGGSIMTGTVGRREGRLQFVDFGRASAILPAGEQIHIESYRPGTRMKFYVKSVAMGSRGPEIIVSRADPQMVAELFRLEIPEVQNGIVEIKTVAREAGARTKVAVISGDENIDPIGSCIGQRGGRIQTIIAELGGEKVDVVQWDDNSEQFIRAALSPAKVKRVELNEAIKEANVTVEEKELSLAIGRGGQNVRLASKLTGWKINILGEKGEVVADSAPEDIEAKVGAATEPAATEPDDKGKNDIKAGDQQEAIKETEGGGGGAAPGEEQKEEENKDPIIKKQ